MKIIVVPDSHSKPVWTFTENQDSHVNKQLVPYHIANRRYDWLSQLIIDEIKNSKPGEEFAIVELGDFADMKSLSSYDKNKKPSENQRIQLDVDYARDARRRMTTPVLQFLAEKKDKKERVPKVRWVALTGNHEHRWSRLKNDEPLWDIFENFDDISGAIELGWELHPFLVPVEINGVHFCHYFTSGLLGKPISGVTAARSLVMKLHKSCVAGHLHEYHVHRESTALGTCIGIVAGCFMEAPEDYAGPQGNPRYWPGITVLEDVENGHFHDRKIPLEHIKQAYYKKEQGSYNFFDEALLA